MSPSPRTHPAHTTDAERSHSRTSGPDHRREHEHSHDDHGHSHGLVHESIKRSREGIRAVLLALGILGLTAIIQTLVFSLSGSVALLADLIHNFGDALTAVPLGVAFLLRSQRAERGAGLFVVAAIFISAAIAGAEAVSRLIHPSPPDHLWAMAAAGAIGYIGNLIAAMSAPVPASAWTAPRSSPTATTRAPTRTSRSRSSRARPSSRSACPSPTRSSASPSHSSSSASPRSPGRPSTATTTTTDGSPRPRRSLGRSRPVPRADTCVHRLARHLDEA